MATMARQFVQARNYTQGRSSPIDVIVIHTMESPEKSNTAEACANYFATTAEASAHYCIDQNSVVQCVRDSDVAWHAPGANHNGLGFEHAGYARQTREEWLGDAASLSLLELSAELAAEKCREYGIPVIWLQPADLRAGRRGITSHANVSKAFQRSDHWDPGSNFPVQRYLTLVRQHLGDEAPPAKPVKDDPATIREGDRGWLVRRLQQRLKALGFEPGLADGIFGSGTKRAVEGFQEGRGLEPDGVVGPLTWRALSNTEAPRRDGRE